MTERQAFPDNKTASDFDEAKLVHSYKPAAAEVSTTLKLCWSPAGRFVAWTPGDATVTLSPWDNSKQALVGCVQEGDLQYSHRVINTGKPVKALALGSSVAGPGADFGTKISQYTPTQNGDDTNGGEVSKTFKPRWFRYHKVEGLILATGFQNGKIRCFNAFTGELILELLDHQQVILDLQFAPDGSLRLASCSAEGTVKLWDLTDDGNMYKTIQPRGYRGHIYACAWAPDARALVIVGHMGLVSVWEISEDKIQERHSLSGHQHSVTSCQFSADGGVLLTASLDSRAILWNPYLGTKLREYGHLFPPPSLIFASGANAAGVTAACLCPDGQHMATICEDNYIRFWNLYSTKGPKQIVPSSDPGPSFCQFSPDGAVLVTGPSNKGISFFATPSSSPPALRLLSRSRIHRQLQRRIPGLKIPKVLEDIVSDGFLPRDIKDFIQYRNLHHP